MLKGYSSNEGGDGDSSAGPGPGPALGPILPPTTRQNPNILYENPKYYPDACGNPATVPWQGDVGIESDNDELLCVVSV